MTYQEYLSTSEWKIKRLMILDRDHYECQCCFKRRSEFINLIKSFGILTCDNVLEKGYSLKKHPSSYDDIEFSKDVWFNPVKYIGDKNKPFELNRLQFALQKIQVNTGFGLKEGYRLICFYNETFIAQNCIDLNIHHKLYIIGKKPWEYNDDALISLCSDCHKKTHEQNNIFVFDQDGNQLYKTEICERCDGSGFLEEFDYYKNGVCFKCSGEGVFLGPESSY